MPRRKPPGTVWNEHLASLRKIERSGNDYAELLESVDPMCRGVVRAIYANHEIWAFPPGAGLNGGSRLRINRTRPGFKMDILHNPGFSVPTTVASRRATMATAPAVLQELLAELLPGRIIAEPTDEGNMRWTSLIQVCREIAQEQGAKLKLFSPLTSKWADTLEIYDVFGSPGRLGVTRFDDDPNDSACVWITSTPEGWLLRLASTRRGAEQTVVREIEAEATAAPERLDELLTEMSQSFVTYDTTAKEVFRSLQRDYIGPLLRERGYKGSNGVFHRIVDDYRVGLGISKSRWSTDKRVDYGIWASVSHLETEQNYRLANEEARALGREMEHPSVGVWHDSFPRNSPSSDDFPLSLRPDDDLALHARQVLDEIDHVIDPEIARQLNLPLSDPTPPSARPLWPSADARREREFERTIRMLHGSGVDLDIQEELGIEEGPVMNPPPGH